MDIDIGDLTLNQMTEISSLVGKNNEKHFYKIGRNYLIRTVLFSYTGKLIDISNKELLLSDAAWIADTGRYNIAVKDSEFDEVEPYQDAQEIIIGRDTVVDAVIINGKLPRKVQ